MKMKNIVIRLKTSFADFKNEFRVLDNFGKRDMAFLVAYLITLVFLNIKLLITAGKAFNTHPNYVLMIGYYLLHLIFFSKLFINNNKYRREQSKKIVNTMSTEKDEVKIEEDIIRNNYNSVELAVMKEYFEKVTNKRNLKLKRRKTIVKALKWIVATVSPFVITIISMLGIEYLKQILLFIYYNWNGIKKFSIVMLELILYFAPLILNFFDSSDQLDDETVAYINLKIRCIDIHSEKMKERSLNM